MSIVRQQTILFVGRDAETAQLIEKTLAVAGYQVAVAPDPEAVRVHGDPPPTLAIVDTTPGLGELAPARLVREQLVTTPIIVLTRLPDEILSRAMERLRLSSLVKPVTPALLLATVADEIEWAQDKGMHTRVTSPLETLDISDDLVFFLGDRRLAPPLNATYRRTTELEEALATAGLSPSNMALFELFDGQHTLADIIANLPHIEPKILLLATYLTRVGWLVQITGELAPDRVSSSASQQV